jgi:uncharacterized protein YyaL (SSP411 family)
MERESFEDDEVARYLNDHFVCIKVDREERPDIDAIYMRFCQALTGEGGWPLTVFMTPDQKPFFAGTYFPKHTRFGRIGLLELAEQIWTRWDKDRATLERSIDKLSERLQAVFQTTSPGRVQADLVDDAIEVLRREFDPEFGGFTSAPKFPTPHNLMLLLRHGWQNGDDSAVAMVETTLEAMYRGGIYDHVGFGFARYSTDRQWLVPHFEKMLYDNALLAIAYTEAYQVTGKQRYQAAARDVLTYVLRDMTHPDGAFYSAEDADSEGVEGKFYLWTPDQVKAVLGDVDGAEYCRLYGIDDTGNFEGASIPNLIHLSDSELERVWGSPDNAEVRQVREWNRRLCEARASRVRPSRDDKILTAWNGLMIAALAKAGRVFGCAEYVTASLRALAFLEANLVDGEGRLYARYREGERAHLGYVDDYAFLIWALLELYDATFDATHLGRALELQRQMMKRFWDADEGGFFLYGDDAETLIARPKEVYDGALPSGNSVAALNLLRLSRITGQGEWTEIAERLLTAFAGEVERYPAGVTYFLMAVQFALVPGREIVVVGSPDSPETNEFLQRLQALFLPDSVIVFRPAKNPGRIAELAPYVAGHEALSGGTTVYLCENYSCQAPSTDLDAVLRVLMRRSIHLH